VLDEAVVLIEIEPLLRPVDEEEAVLPVSSDPGLGAARCAGKPHVPDRRQEIDEMQSLFDWRRHPRPCRSADAECLPGRTIDQQLTA
jgi:hypothetical protein